MADSTGNGETKLSRTRKFLGAMPWTIKVTLGLMVLFIVLMILFNYLAVRNELAAENYQEYASYCFDTLKVLVGAILAALGLGAENKFKSGGKSE